MAELTSIRVDPSHEGLTGLAHGGWTAWLMANAIDEPVSISFLSPIPLDTDLTIEPTTDLRRSDGEGWRLFDPADPDTTILEAAPWTPDCPETDPVSLEQARVAQAGFPLGADQHPAPNCLSCGYGPHSLGIQSGPLDDGRWANVWKPTGWAVLDDGSVDVGALWASTDCSAGWYVSCEGDQHRPTVTVQLAIEVLEPLRAEHEYVMVAWNGDHPDEWQGRKRGAAGAVFDADGTCVARSRSFWVAMPEELRG